MMSGVPTLGEPSWIDMARRRAVHARVMVEALGVDASMVSATL
jgi:hypothetical protein